MSVMKSCLAVFGLGVLLLLGACVLGVGAIGTGMSSVIDPKTASGRIEQPEAEVRQAVYDYLDGATSGAFAARARVDAMSDGTMRLVIGTGEPREMEMTAAFEPDGAATKLTATYNADRLAWNQPGDVKSTNLHRCIRDDFVRFAKAVHNGESADPIDLQDLIARSRRGDRDLSCDLTATVASSMRDYAMAEDAADTRVDRYAPPPPAFGKPDPRAGRPTMPAPSQD
jgi:hypothetical protein